jgi:GT2 family glycosyltransferase
MRVAVVIVNYRTARLVVDCLASIAQERGGEAACHVVVVDNASGDGSVEALRQATSHAGWDWVSLLPLARNGGFACGNNAGIRHALQSPECRYVLLLNPDTVLKHDAIRALVAFMDARPDVGLAGSALEDAAGVRQPSARNAPSPLGELESGARLGLLSRLLSRHAVGTPAREAAHECDWLSGASVMIRREVFDEVGLLDEGYFLYFEEVDFCRRARRRGWKCWFVPESRVVHLEGASTGITQARNRRPRYWYDSRRRYFLKHYGVPGLLLADGLWAAGRASLALRRVLRLGRGGATQDPRGLARDLLLGDARALLTGKARQPR